MLNHLPVIKQYNQPILSCCHHSLNSHKHHLLIQNQWMLATSDQLQLHQMYLLTQRSRHKQGNSLNNLLPSCQLAFKVWTFFRPMEGPQHWLVHNWQVSFSMILPQIYNFVYSKFKGYKDIIYNNNYN